MATIENVSTQKSKGSDVDYNFRKEEDVFRFVRYLKNGNSKGHPVYKCFRGLRNGVDASDAADEMLEIQKLHHKETGLRLRGEIISVRSEELTKGKEEQQIKDIADGFSDYIFYKGFQTVYSVMPNNAGYNIIYGINPVSYTAAGRKYKHNQTTVKCGQQEFLDMVVEKAVTGNSDRQDDLLLRLPYYQNI